MTTPVSVDVWSDIACPWCYIGKRRFEAGAAAFENPESVVVTYHSFELAPDTPVDFDGSEVDFLRQHKGWPAAQVEQMLAQVSSVAASVGLAYDFEALRHTKTLKAHEALHHARSQGKQLDVVERLFAAYFVEGRHVGRVEEIADLAAETGLDRARTLEVLTSGELAGAVQADIEQARQYGITGVPFYVIGGRFGVSGAQSPEVFTAALRRARDTTQVGASHD